MASDWLPLGYRVRRQLQYRLHLPIHLDQSRPVKHLDWPGNR